MNLYTNGFRCSAQNKGDELILYFLQVSPTFDSSGVVSGTSTETVSSLVMTKELAGNLQNVLAQLLSGNPDKE